MTLPRVAVVGHVSRLSGAELALARTLPALTTKAEVVVVLAEHGPLVDLLEGDGVRVVVLPLAGALRDLGRQRVLSLTTVRRLGSLAAYVYRLRSLLRRLEVDVVHTNTLKAALYGGVAGRLAGIPVIWHVRDRIAPDYLPRAVVALVRGLSLFLPSAVIANSLATAKTLPRRSQRISSPVVHDPVRRDEQAHGHVPGPPTVGLIGRISPWKGQDLFLRAFVMAFGDRPNVRARLVGSAMFGEDEYEQSLHVLVETLGLTDRVDFRGFRQDVWAELAELTVAVHCSTVPEPFGQVVLEAMAAGVPVVAAGEGGPAEIVTPGVDGLLTTPRDVSSLATAMRTLVDDPALCDRLSTAGRLTAADYSPERTAAAIAAVYDIVLRR